MRLVLAVSLGWGLDYMYKKILANIGVVPYMEWCCALYGVVLCPVRRCGHHGVKYLEVLQFARFVVTWRWGSYVSYMTTRPAKLCTFLY